jgi:ATP-GRASP peptide maturase of grasp-with-spasm system
MILIISQDKREVTTNQVIDWLFYFSANFTRINGIDLYLNSLMEFSENLDVEISNCNLKHVNVVWFRRWYSMSNFQAIYLKNSRKVLNYNINSFLRAENRVHSEFFIGHFGDKVINGNKFTGVNKLVVLNCALKIGLKIPRTKVVTKIRDIDKESKWITKAMSEAPFLNYGNKTFVGYTTDFNIMECGTDNIHPSLIQEKIEKEFEIRAFLLNQDIYSMAIFSQASEMTKTDFRNYDNSKPNRMCPYLLDNEISIKLIQLAKQLGLSTGSFDLVMSKEGIVYFLEVNPEGQFGMVSIPCNYYLEKKFAEYLIKLNNEKIY